MYKLKSYFIYLFLFFLALVGCTHELSEYEITINELRVAMQTDSSLIILDVRTQPELAGSLGQIEGVINIPVQELNQRIDELEEYKEKVYDAQKHAYVGSMGAIVAHQLNQPLTMINMLLGRTIEQLKDESCHPSVLKDIEESLDESKKAASIITKFREYARDPAFEVGGIVNVSSTANKVISSLAEKAEHTRMNISVKGLDGLPEVEISEMGLEQIFFNIIQNALEAADGKERHNLIITGKSTDEKVQLQFSDDCCGIAPENLDKIFEPFFSTKINGKRLGFGLEVIQQILISCGGEIRVESQLGKGTTFYVTLPISKT